MNEVGHRPASPLPSVIVAAVGAALGLSQAIQGAYDEATWSTVAVGVSALLVALAIAMPRRPPRAAVATLLGLALWSLISSGWADSADDARVAADRWFLYAVALALLARLIGGERRRAELLIAGAATGVAAVLAWMLVQMLRSHGASLFLGNRLNDPLGYVNGEAGYLLAGVWPCCALAQRRASAPLAGLGLGGLVALVGVGALARSRSWELALIVSALVIVAIFPGRRRRLAILLVAGVAIFAIHHALSAVSGPALATQAAVEHAAAAILAAAAISGTAWGVIVWLLERLAPPGSSRRVRAARVAGVALVGVGLAGGVGAALNGPRIVHAAGDQYRAFTRLSTSAGGDRLLSGAGNRYDYWRVAWLEFTSEPLRGVGAGNYQPGYYRYRRTTEAIQQPHSLELQTLAELGLVGGALLAALLAVVAVAIGRIARRARAEAAERPLAVAATGLFLGWLVQTSVDWEHLIPGLTVMALGAVAALLSGGEPALQPLTRSAHATLIGALAALACAGAVLIVPRVVSLAAQSAAERALADGGARAAIADATRALDYDGSSVQALVLRSAAFARLDAFTLAREDLQRALRIEPDNWTTDALMGDLLTRRGEIAAARTFYRRARALDPLEPSLVAALAPRSTPRRP